MPPLLGHDPSLATRVTMSDARCRTAAPGEVDDPPTLGAEGEAGAPTAPVGEGGAATADAGEAVDGVGSSRAAAAVRDATACATATAPGVCPTTGCSTWLSAPLVDQPSLTHLRSARITSELPAAVVAEQGLAPGRWCSRPYRAVRGWYGQSSLASHEAQCRLNPRGRRRGREATAADVAPAQPRAPTQSTASAGMSARADLFSADPPAWARARDAFLLRVAPAGASRAPLVESGARTPQHVPSALLGAWRSLAADALDWVRRKPERQAAWLWLMLCPSLPLLSSVSSTASVDAPPVLS